MMLRSMENENAMAASKKRTDDDYYRFAGYLADAGLEAGIRAVCARHFVSLRQVYEGERGQTVQAARLEAWWWLTSEIGKSAAEVGRIFDVDSTTVIKGLRRLREAVEESGIQYEVAQPSVIVAAAKALLVRTAESLAQAGRASSARWVAARKVDA